MSSRNFDLQMCLHVTVMLFKWYMYILCILKKKINAVLPLFEKYILWIAIPVSLTLHAYSTLFES